MFANYSHRYGARLLTVLDLVLELLTLGEYRLEHSAREGSGASVCAGQRRATAPVVAGFGGRRRACVDQSATPSVAQHQRTG